MKFFCKYFIKYSRTYKKIDLKSIILIKFTLMEYQQDRLMINPLLKNKLEVEDDDKIVELTTVNLSKYFKEIYVLTPLKDINIGDSIYFRDIKKKDWQDLGPKLVLEKSSLRLIKNFNFNHNLCLVNSKDLEIFNHFGFDLEDKEIVIPIFEVSYKNLKLYLKVYEGLYSLQEVYKILLINDINESGNNQKLSYNCQSNLVDIIKSLEESRYWTRKYNCLMNISKAFARRNFKLKVTVNMKDNEILDAINEISKDDVINNYLDKIFDSSNFVDASCCLKKGGYKLYYIGKPSELSKNDVFSMFLKLNNIQRYFLFSNLLISKRYCHLVLNNSDVLILMSNFLKCFGELFRYLIGYAWNRFYIEEGIKSSKITKDDDFIFDINTASMLPVYPFSLFYPKANPYFTCLIDDKLLKYNKNMGGFTFYNADSKYLNQGITNLDGFLKRFNVFMTGNSSNNIFNNLDWKELGMAISGSIMAACLQKKHPLMELIKGKNNFENTSEFDLDYMRYFNEYYPEADLDVMIKSSHPLDFIKKVKEIYNQVVVNVCSFNPINTEPNHIKIYYYKTIFIFVDESFIRENIVSNKLKFEDIVKNIGTDDVKNIFNRNSLIQKKIQEFYDNLFEGTNSKELELIKNDNPEVFDDNICDFQIHIKQKNNSTDIGVNITFKSKIKSNHINRTLELFPIHGDDFFSLVSKFHLPCVRSYYDGENVYLTPSCVSAHLTYMNLDYKYFAGSNDEIKIILKYRMRGFGTILNKNEIDKVLKYINKVTFWKRLYDLNLEDNDSIKETLGSLSFDNKLFQPRLYNADLFDDNIAYVNITEGYNEIPADLNKLKTLDDMGSYLINIMGSFSLELNLIASHTINAKGFINPVSIDKIICVFDKFYNSVHSNENLDKFNLKDDNTAFKEVKNEIWDVEEIDISSEDSNN